MMLWSAFHVRTENVLSVGRRVTWSRTAPLSLHVGIVGESGHRAPECPKAANVGETPVFVGGTWAKMATKSRPRRAPVAKSTGVRCHGQQSASLVQVG